MGGVSDGASHGFPTASHAAVGKRRPQKPVRLMRSCISVSYLSGAIATAFSKVLCQVKLIVSRRSLGLALSQDSPVMSGLLPLNVVHYHLY